jgi:hypothetical protein
VSEPAVPTGRLFRSLRAEGSAAESAIPALALDQAVGLRTVTLGAGSTAEAPAPAPASAPAPTPVPHVAAAVVAQPEVLEYAEVAPRPEPDESIEVGAAVITGPSEQTGRRAHAAPGVRPAGVWLVVIGITVVMAFADALVVGRTQLGWLTGISLLAASVYGALVVRREDAIIAVIAPPLAFFLATITAGQLTLPPTGDLLVREAFMIVTTLGANAAWIFGSTIIALVIVLVRRRRSTPATPSPQP